MNDLKKIADEKKASRQIVKEIIDFGVNESQKIDIIYFLSLTLQDNTKMKEICEFIKKYKKEININENTDNTNNNKIILE